MENLEKEFKSALEKLNIKNASDLNTHGIIDGIREKIDDVLPGVLKPLGIIGNFLSRAIHTVQKGITGITDAFELDIYNTLNQLTGKPDTPVSKYSLADFQRMLRDEECPCAVLDLETFDENLDFFEREILGTGKTLRIGTKSVRVPALIKRAMDRHCFKGAFLFHPNEIEYLQENYGVNDFILAYPIMNVKEADTCAIAAKKDPNAKISVMADSTAHFHLLEKSAARLDVILHVILDISMGFDFLGQYAGVLRSPIETPDAAVRLAKKVNRFPHLEFRGIMGYEAQEAGTGDHSLLYKLMKLQSRSHVTSIRARTVQALEREGMPCEIVNGGGSGCFQDTSRETFVTEITVGSGLFKSYIFDPIESMAGLKPSLFMGLRVVRETPKPGVVTAFSGGFVSSAINKPPKIVLPGNCTVTDREGFGEVQTPIQFDPNEVFLKVGDIVMCRFAKAGEPLERFNQVVAISDGKIVESYPTYRGEGLWLG